MTPQAGLDSSPALVIAASLGQGRHSLQTATGALAHFLGSGFRVVRPEYRGLDNYQYCFGGFLIIIRVQCAPTPYSFSLLRPLGVSGLGGRGERTELLLPLGLEVADKLVQGVDLAILRNAPLRCPCCCVPLGPLLTTWPCIGR